MSKRSAHALSLAAALAASFLAISHANAAADIWNATGGSGDGITWDTIQPNWDGNGTVFATGDSVTFNDANGGNYTVNVPGSISTSGITATNTASAYTISIAPSATLTDTGTVTLGQTAVVANTVINLTGGGAYDQTGGNIVLSANNALGTAPAGVLNAAGLTSFTYNVPTGVIQLASNLNGGNLASGNATRTLGCLTLATGAASSNLLVALAIDVGDSGGGNGGGTSSITLGSGSNTIQSNTIIIGHGKNSGLIQATAGGAVTITGTAGGSSNANFTIGVGSSGSGTGTTSQLNLFGANATVQAGNLTVGQLAGNTSGTPSGSLSFSTGTFNVATGLSVGTATSGNSTGGVKGALTIGSSSASTGAFNVSGNFIIGNDSDTGNAVRTDTASVTINGGTVNSNVAIISNNNTPATDTINSTLSLLGGTLNMNGNQIGHASGNNTHLTAVNLPVSANTATLMNLGGTGINDAGLTMNTAGTLILAGSNTYSNNTNVTNGSLFLDGSYTGTGAFSVSSGATLGGKGSSSAPASIAVGGFLSPGDNSINTLALTGVTLAGTLNIDVNDADPNVVDLLNDSAAPLDISASTSAVTFNVTNTLSAPAYIFATYSSLTGSAFGTVNNLPAGYNIDYDYLGNNDIALVSSGGGSAPEPASLALLGLGGAVLLRKRR